EAEDVPARAARAGARLRAGLESLPQVDYVRGQGLLLAAELVSLPSRPVVAAALEAGLLVNPVTPTALRLTPSLLVSDAEIDEAVAILATVMATAADGGAVQEVVT
ncbi:MAG: aminotransferase class III-fold pyridoxal phosphate-dependent enzyme, partial [Acidimicrobiales bacterium]